MLTKIRNIIACGFSQLLAQNAAAGDPQMRRMVIEALLCRGADALTNLCQLFAQLRGHNKAVAKLTDGVAGAHQGVHAQVKVGVIAVGNAFVYILAVCLAVLHQEQNKKKPEEITQQEKDDVHNTEKAISDEKAKRNEIISGYAKNNNIVHQLIDLALLQNGMLKGASLDAFLKRSVDMIK